MTLTADDRATALRILSTARMARINSQKVPDAVTDDPAPPWRVAAVTCWLVRVAAGIFDNSPGDFTDDPACADHIIRQARYALDEDTQEKSELMRQGIRQALHLVGLATPDTPPFDAAERYHHKCDDFAFDSWVVTDAALNLLRLLSDMAATGFGGNALADDRLLDVLSARLIEETA